MRIYSTIAYVIWRVDHYARGKYIAPPDDIGSAVGATEAQSTSAGRGACRAITSQSIETRERPFQCFAQRCGADDRSPSRGT
jgi:hypothetical protein